MHPKAIIAACLVHFHKVKPHVKAGAIALVIVAFDFGRELTSHVVYYAWIASKH